MTPPLDILIPIRPITSVRVGTQTPEVRKSSRQRGRQKAEVIKQQKRNVVPQTVIARSLTGSKLTPMQALFVKYYLADPKLRAGLAAEKAGYKDPSATGSLLLENPRVKEEIQKVLKVTTADLEITTERTLREVAKIAYSNMIDYLELDENGNLVVEDGKVKVDLSRLNKNSAACIQEITSEEAYVDIPTEVAGITKRTKVIRQKFRMYNKLEGLQMLANYQKLGMEKEDSKGLTINILDAIINMANPQITSGQQKQLSIPPPESVGALIEGSVQ